MRVAFVIGRGSAATTRESAIARQVNIFEGIFTSNVQGDEPSGESNWDGDRGAREADETQGRIVECNLPLGVEFEEKGRGDIYIKSVDQDSDAWSQGVRAGAQVTWMSATFGDEMWSARGVGMTQFMTGIRSRFGNTLKLSLDKENRGFLDDFFSSLQKSEEAQKPKSTKSQEELMKEFEAGEKNLEGKSFWDPFR